MNDKARSTNPATAPPSGEQTHSYFAVKAGQLLSGSALMLGMERLPEEGEKALAHVLSCRYCQQELVRAAGELSVACLVARPLITRYAHDRIQLESLEELLAAHYESCLSCADALHAAQEWRDLDSLTHRAPHEADAVRLALALSTAALAGHASARALLLMWLGSGELGAREVAIAVRKLEYGATREAARQFLDRQSPATEKEVGDERRTVLAYLVRREITLNGLELRLAGMRLADARSGTPTQEASLPNYSRQAAMPDRTQPGIWQRPAYSSTGLSTLDSDTRRSLAGAMSGPGRPRLVLEWVEKEHRRDQRLVARVSLEEWREVEKRDPGKFHAEEVAMWVALRPLDWKGTGVGDDAAIAPELPSLPAGFHWEGWTRAEGAMRTSLSKADEHVEICLARAPGDAGEPSAQLIRDILEWLQAHLFFAFE